MLFAALLPRRHVTLHQHYTIKKKLLAEGRLKKRSLVGHTISIFKLKCLPCYPEEFARANYLKKQNQLCSNATIRGGNN
jgi:hypothetical protein